MPARLAARHGDLSVRTRLLRIKPLARLTALGADVSTVLPPAGDPLQQLAGAYFEELHHGQAVVHLDLKDPAGRARLDELLAVADVLLTSSRPSAHLSTQEGDLT